jgi:hypothetical protein
MKFSTSSSIPRPIRLSDDIRNWAWESMHGKYGDEAVINNCIPLDDIEDFESLSLLQKYDAAIMRIARQAPLRICEAETICGSATLGRAIQHLVPVS